ncbi:MAG: molybdenum cofactor guanylyltransferase [Thaumarchaeota archaeon]|nr:molybdenum cofactor guanylyltransferase [Nitrososphaerota archaeon]
MKGAIVLAGGKSSRMGENKALMTLMDKKMLTHVIERVEEVVDSIVVAIGFQEDPDQYRMAVPPHVSIISDSVNLRSPLVGMLAGIEFLSADYVSVHPCDTPLLEPSLLHHLFRRAEGHDAAISVTRDGRVQPLNAVYKASVTYSSCKEALRRGDTKCKKMIERLRDVIFLNSEELMKFDPDLRTYINVNTKKELEELNRLLTGTYAPMG